jgi:RHS repeat-associated protein
VEENAYYPFGLQQQGISSKAAGRLLNKEKTFQGQRFDDELGLNWVQFKWRNHDPQTGRFIEIDPLAKDYVYNSTYAFSENKVTNHIELEGLEAISAGSPQGYLSTGLGQWFGAFGKIIDKINFFHGGEFHNNNETKVTTSSTLPNGNSIESSTTLTLVERSTIFKIGSVQDFFRYGKFPVEYYSATNSLSKVEQKKCFINSYTRGAS